MESAPFRTAKNLGKEMRRTSGLGGGHLGPVRCWRYALCCLLVALLSSCLLVFLSCCRVVLLFIFFCYDRSGCIVFVGILCFILLVLCSVAWCCRVLCWVV